MSNKYSILTICEIEFCIFFGQLNVSYFVYHFIYVISNIVVKETQLKHAGYPSSKNDIMKEYSGLEKVK